MRTALRSVLLACAVAAGIACGGGGSTDPGPTTPADPSNPSDPVSPANPSDPSSPSTPSTPAGPPTVTAERLDAAAGAASCLRGPASHRGHAYTTRRSELRGRRVGRHGPRGARGDGRERRRRVPGAVAGRRRSRRAPGPRADGPSGLGVAPSRSRRSIATSPSPTAPGPSTSAASSSSTSSSPRTARSCSAVVSLRALVAGAGRSARTRSAGPSCR